MAEPVNDAGSYRMFSSARPRGVSVHILARTALSPILALQLLLAFLVLFVTPASPIASRVGVC